MKETENNDLLLAGEISRQLRIPLSTLYRLSKNGTIKAVKIGRQWRYPVREVSRYLGYKYEPNTIERRRSPRINCYLNCKLNLDLIPVKRYSASGTIRNISADGLLLELDETVLENIDRGDPLRLTFNLNSGTILETDARAVWKTAKRCGIKFRCMEEGYRDLLIRYVG